MEITYQSIESLIQSHEIEGQMVKVKFKANNQDQAIETMAYVAPDQEEMMAEIKKQMAKSMATGVAGNIASSAIGNAIGGVGGQLAKTAGSAATSHLASNAIDPEKLMKTEMTDTRVQAAIVQAFQSLQTFYKFENGNWTYQAPVA